MLVEKFIQTLSWVLSSVLAFASLLLTESQTQDYQGVMMDKKGIREVI